MLKNGHLKIGEKKRDASPKNNRLLVIHTRKTLALASLVRLDRVFCAPRSHSDSWRVRTTQNETIVFNKKILVARKAKKSHEQIFSIGRSRRPLDLERINFQSCGRLFRRRRTRLQTKRAREQKENMKLKTANSRPAARRLNKNRNFYTRERSRSRKRAARHAASRLRTVVCRLLARPPARRRRCRSTRGQIEGLKRGAFHVAILSTRRHNPHRQSTPEKSRSRDRQHVVKILATRRFFLLHEVRLASSPAGWLTSLVAHTIAI